MMILSRLVPNLGTFKGGIPWEIYYADHVPGFSLYLSVVGIQTPHYRILSSYLIRGTSVLTSRAE